MDDLIELFEGDTWRSVWADRAAGGKSREIEIGIAYEIYLLSCMREPGRRLRPDSRFDAGFPERVGDVKQAQRMLFGGLKRCEE